MIVELKNKKPNTKGKKMSFGNNIAERSRKQNLLTMIRISMVRRMSMDETLAATKGWIKKTKAELEILAREETVK